MGNLISLADRPPEERTRIAQMGAAASVEARRRIRQIRENRELFFKCADDVPIHEIALYLDERERRLRREQLREQLQGLSGDELFALARGQFRW